VTARRRPCGAMRATCAVVNGSVPSASSTVVSQMGRRAPQSPPRGAAGGGVILSRVSDFGDVYSGSRDRLLLQLYAYCGDPDAADDALNEAFITASHHWHRVATLGNVDGWLRQRAIRRLDGGRRSPAPARPGRPSPRNARLLACLHALDPTSRRLLIVRRLDNLDVGRSLDLLRINGQASGDQASHRQLSEALGYPLQQAGLMLEDRAGRHEDERFAAGVSPRLPVRPDRVVELGSDVTDIVW